ncbi:uncharacterized protein LOC134296380 [Anolis carolinensis]|uniref:uncharacterized protein LOC134296380 n=1 Tax=Anolis carolinensis TaxID=28377 RepID=UPI002F2B642A
MGDSNPPLGSKPFLSYFCREPAKIILVLVKRVAQVSFNETSEKMLEELSICPEGMALQLWSLLKSLASLLQRLCSTWEAEVLLKHSAGVVAFYIQLLHIGQCPHSPEKTWVPLMAWLQHCSLAFQHQSRQGLLLLCKTYRETIGLQEFLDGVLGELRSPPQQCCPRVSGPGCCRRKIGAPRRLTWLLGASLPSTTSGQDLKGSPGMLPASSLVPRTSLSGVPDHS